jgi:hypothetical protein
MLRVFFKFKRKLLGELCRCAVRALLFYFQAAAGTSLEPGVVAVIQDKIGEIRSETQYPFPISGSSGPDGMGGIKYCVSIFLTVSVAVRRR